MLFYVPMYIFNISLNIIPAIPVTKYYLFNDYLCVVAFKNILLNTDFFLKKTLYNVFLS